ncbi:hypothetical protein HC928_19705 [bacterium]|nr:hypothetical protein [bacterium]
MINENDNRLLDETSSRLDIPKSVAELVKKRSRYKQAFTEIIKGKSSLTKGDRHHMDDLLQELQLDREMAERIEAEVMVQTNTHIPDRESKLPQVPQKPVHRPRQTFKLSKSVVVSVASATFAGVIIGVPIYLYRQVDREYQLAQETCNSARKAKEGFETCIESAQAVNGFVASLFGFTDKAKVLQADAQRHVEDKEQLDKARDLASNNSRLKAIAIANQVPPSSLFYQDTLVDLKDWSQQVIDRFSTLASPYESAEVSKAIESLKAIPSELFGKSISVKEDAETKAKQMEDKKGQRAVKIDAAKKASDSQEWQAFLDACKEIELYLAEAENYVAQWTQEAKELIDKAEVEQAQIRAANQPKAAPPSRSSPSQPPPELKHSPSNSSGGQSNTSPPRRNSSSSRSKSRSGDNGVDVAPMDPVN